MCPKVSIVIATYNSSKTIRTALESVLKQKFCDWECIIVDGNSSDSTVDIVKEFVVKDSRFSFISEKDNGIYDAFNKGWKRSKGEWIHYLGSDDKLTENSFLPFFSSQNDEFAVLSGSAYIQKQDNTVVLQKSNLWEGCHQAKLTRRSVIESLNGFDEKYKILADLDLYVRMKNAGYLVRNIEDPIAYFAMDGVSQKISTLFRRYNEYLSIFKSDKTESHPRTHAFIILVRSFMSILYRKIRKFM